MADEDILKAVAKRALQPSIVPSMEPRGGKPQEPGPNTVDLNDPAQRRQFIDVLRREAPAFIGGTLLSMAVPQAGIPAQLARLPLRTLTGPGVASTVGRTALGGAAGEAIAGLPGDIQALLTGGDLPSPDERQSALTKAAVTEGAGQLVGMAGTRTLQKVLAPLERAVPPQVQQTLDFLRESRIGKRLKLSGPAFTPAEATTSPAPDILQNVADRFVLSTPIMSAFRTQRKAELLDGLAREIINEAGPSLTAEQLSHLVVEAAENNFKIAEAPARSIYKGIDQVLRDKITTIPASPFVNAAGQPIREARQVVEPALRIDFSEIRRDPEIANVIEKAVSPASDAKLGATIFERFRRLGPKPTYLEAQEFATSLKADSRELSATAGGETGAARARLLLGKVNNAINTALGQFDKSNGTQLLETKLFADGLLKQAKDEFNPRVVKEVVNLLNPHRAGDVEQFTQVALRTPSRIQSLKKALGGDNAPAMEKVRAFVVQDLLERRGVDAQQTLTADSLRRGLSSFGENTSASRQVLGEVFSGRKDILEAVDRLADALEIAEGKFVGKAGSLAVAFETTGAFTGLLKLGQKGANRSIGTFLRFTGGSVAAAQLLTSKKGAHWLIEGVKLPANSEKAATVVARLLAEAARAGIELKFEGTTTESGDPAIMEQRSLKQARQPGPSLDALLGFQPPR